jgi:cytochrome c-type biogenesis protein CcmH
VSSAWNARVKRWPGWVALLFVVVGLLAVGVSRDTGPQTPEERITALEKRLACPVCQGESVYESRNAASVQIRELIRQGVEQGQLSDQQIIDGIVTRYNGEELLVPTSSGVEALAWALPAAAFVAGVAGLVVAFRRWHASAQQLGDPTEEDYALVAAALEHEQIDDEP